ncbi:plasmid stabilization protein [uncultured Aliiroseovarius sp.]|uniref:FitA-like ribbon-helix-helix domain-containing protein n=1 Tax=uncultured Aliiroseovarius sp. TaxID=1658783 RepID=UPI00260969DA|nr:plasmid stabilization protein [uncultured Aliiroseovarius sp.]
MGNMSIRNLPDEIHEALKHRAAQNNRSAEAEVRALLVETFEAEQKGGFGTRLRACFEGIEGDELDIARDKTAAQPLELE